MFTLKGTIRGGRVALPRRADLPDGTVVTVLSHDYSKTLGIPDAEWPTDPDSLAQLLARMEQVEPFDMTPTEEAEIEAWRLKVKEHTISHQTKRIEGHLE